MALRAMLQCPWYNFEPCGCSSVDRASVFGTEGREFESLQPRTIYDLRPPENPGIFYR